jgi:hypothetical protein
MTNIQRNNKIIELTAQLKYIDYLENMMCGRELTYQGRQYLEKEKLRINNQINYELRIIEGDIE